MEPAAERKMVYVLGVLVAVAFGVALFSGGRLTARLSLVGGGMAALMALQVEQHRVLLQEARIDPAMRQFLQEYRARPDPTSMQRHLIAPVPETSLRSFSSV